MIVASKDQTLGWLIFIVCLVVSVGYTIALAFPSVMFGWINPKNVQMWLIGVPVFIGFIGILAIGGWIEWTMATTPPPMPIEEIEQKEEDLVVH